MNDSEPIYFGTVVNREPLGDPIPVNPGFTIEPYQFKVSDKNEPVDGALFRMEPFATTNIVTVTAENQIMQETWVDGSGYLLVYRKGEGVLVYDTHEPNESQNPGEPANRVYEYTTGDTIVWIAREQGLQILNVNTPAFTDDTEKVITVGDPEIPEVFWKIYNELTQVSTPNPA